MIATVNESVDQPKIDADRHIWMALRVALVVSVFIAYAPVFTADFTVWDDWFNVVENPRLNPPTWSGLAFYWTHSAFDLYAPVTYTIWAGLAKVAYVNQPDSWGSHLNSYVFHAANVLLHAGSALIVLEILRKVFGAKASATEVAQPRVQRQSHLSETAISRDALAASAGAFVFALHPVQVEAVAWVAGLKDVAAGMLALGAIAVYLGHRESQIPDRRFQISNLRFAWATLLFVLAMLAKPIGMMVPLMVVVIEWMRRCGPKTTTPSPCTQGEGRGEGSSIANEMHPLPIPLPEYREREKAWWPLGIWFAIAIACAVVAKLSQPAPFAGIVVPIWQRPLVAGDALAFYLFKIVWPIRLGVDYGRTPVQTLASHWPYLTSLVPVAIVVLLWIKRRTWRPAIAGAMIFVLGLLPILGLVPFDFQIYSTVADHYLYLPMLGIAMIVAFAVLRWNVAGNAHPTIAVVILLALLGVLTFRQAMTWKDSLTLFNHALEVNPRSWMAQVNLASALNRSQRPEEAEAHALAALTIRSDVAIVYDNLAASLRLQGRKADAIDAYRHATALDPKDSLAWTGLGHLLSDQNDLPAAIDAYQHAVDASPYDPDTRINLASALAEQGQLKRAIELYQSALKLKPNSPEALAGLDRAADALRKKSERPAH